jgi:hypothetical protein
MKRNATDVHWRNRDYDIFKTGLTYYEVWRVLRQEKEAGRRYHVTRHTVLGKWHELKLSMYQALLEQYGAGGEADEVPF